jgi:membrane associated rhomboid family serine protease
MVEVVARSTGGSVEVDVCTPCHFVWFDAGELEALPGRAPAPESEKIPLAARLSEEDRWELAHAQVEDLAARYDEARGEEVRQPETPFEWFRWLFGLPITARSRLAEVPVVTLLTAAAIAVIGIWTMGSDDAIIAFGLVPAEWDRLGGLTLFTSFFLHADAEHLVGNLAFFLIVGAGAEDLLGRGRFVLLLVAATLAGGAAHVLAEPASTVPCVGASGGISGLLGFFAAKNPSAKIGLVLGLPWIRIPVGAVLLLFACLQLPELIFQLQGNTDVAATAHLGGAIVGIAFFFLYRKL